MTTEFNKQHPNLSLAVQMQCSAGCVSTVDEFNDDPQEAIDYSITALEMWRQQRNHPQYTSCADEMIAFHEQRISTYRKSI